MSSFTPESLRNVCLRSRHNSTWRCIFIGETPIVYQTSCCIPWNDQIPYSTWIPVLTSHPTILPVSTLDSSAKNLSNKKHFLDFLKVSLSEDGTNSPMFVDLWSFPAKPYIPKTKKNTQELLSKYQTVWSIWWTTNKTSDSSNKIIWKFPQIQQKLCIACIYIYI